MSDTGSGWFNRKRTASRSKDASKVKRPRAKRSGIMALEPRMMYDAAGAATAGAAASHHHHSDGVDHGQMFAAEKALDHMSNVQTPNAQNSAGNVSGNASASSNTSGNTPGNGPDTSRSWHRETTEQKTAEPMPHVTTWVKDPTEIVFIDPQAPDYQILAAGVKPGIEVVVLDPNSDGVQQIANFLQRHPDPNLTTIDIVAHGQDGMLFLGNAVLDNDTVGQYAAQLKTIGAAMQSGGDLMLYGCDVAADPQGLILLDQIVGATGANVAASAGPVGSAAEGGSWSLNVTAGAIDAVNPFTAATQALYPDVLNADLIGIVNDGGNGDGVVVATDPNGGAPGAATGVTTTSIPSLASAGNPQQIQLDVTDGLYFVLEEVGNGKGSTILEGSLSQVLSGATPTFTTIFSDSSTANAVNAFQVDTADNVIFFNEVVNFGNSQLSDHFEVINFSGAHFSGTATTTNVATTAGVNLAGMVVDPTHHAAYFYETSTSSNAIGPHGGISTGTAGQQHVGTVIGKDELFKATWNGTNNSPTQFTLSELPIAQQGDASSLGANNLPTSLGELNSLVLDSVNQILYFDTDSINGSSGGIYKYNLTGNSTGAFSAVWTQTSAVPGALTNLVIDTVTGKYYVSVSDGSTVGKNDIYDGSLSGGAPSLFTSINTSAGDPGERPIGLAVDEAPVVTTSASTVTYSVGGNPVTVDNPGAGITVSDADNSQLASATVSVTNFQAGDVLGIPAGDLTSGKITGTNISESYNTATGVLTLSGTDTAADYKLALSEVTYSSTAGAPSATPRTVKFTVSDGFATGSATDTVDVHVPPSIGAGASVTFTGGGNPVALDPGLTVSDSGSATLASATVTISSGLITGDTLNFTNNGSTEGNITGSYSNGVLTLTSAAATATLAQWQTALESVTYSFSPANDDPTGGGTHTSRGISWLINDGSSSSLPATSTLTVAHAAPAVTAGASVTFTGGGSAVTLDAGLTLTDPDSSNTLASATVTIAGAITGDTLSFTNNGSTEGNITGSYSNGVLTLNSIGATATLAQWTAALDSIAYSFAPGNGDPTGGGTHTSRTINWVVNDGVANSVSASSLLNVVHAAPVVTAGATATYETGSTAPVVLDSPLTVSDVDSGGNLTGATVQIGTGFASGDTLVFTTQNGISGAYTAGSGLLVLSGTATLAQYQTALESIAFSTTSNSTTARNISWTVKDGSSSNGSNAPAATSVVNVEIGPHVTASGTVAFTGGGSAVTLDAGLTLTDSASTTLSSATVSITGFIAGDVLNFVNQNNIISSYNAGTGVLTLSGKDTIANYTAALDSITFGFAPANGDPTGGGTHLTRTINWTVSDGTATSNTGSSGLTTAHAAPVVTAGAVVSYETGGATPVTLDSALTASDVDSGGNLTGAKVQITGGLVAGDFLSFTTQNGISGSYLNGILTLSGTASVANYQAALDSIAFSTSATASGTRTISWTVTDGSSSNGSNSPAATSTVNVLTGPLVTAGASVTFNGGGSAVVLDSGLTISDSASAVLAGATVTIGTSVSGDTLTINGLTVGDINNGGNGAIHYSFSGSTLTLTGTDTMADYQAALEAVNYSFTPANGDPTGGGAQTSRGISWSVNDGAVSSAAASSSLTTVHVAPVVTAGANVAYESGGTIAVPLDNGLTVSDVDSGGTLTGAKVQIAAGLDGSDVLNFTTQNGITGVYASGLLTLSGTASVANYQAALDSITFTTSAAGAGSRTIDWTVTDGSTSHGSNTPVATSTVNVLAGPQVTAGGAVTFSGGGNAVTLDSGLTVADPFSTTLSGATVTIATGNVTGDTLSINGTTTGDINNGGNGTIHYSFAGSTLTLTGTDTVADYQLALEAVQYGFTPGNGDPTGGGTHTSRTIDWTVNDGNANAVAATSMLTTVHVSPTVTAGATVTYELGGTAVAVDAALTVADADSGGNLTGATVKISSGLQSGDALNFTDQNGITGGYDSGTGLLTLSAASPVSLADFQAALDSITFSTSATVAGARTIAWTVNDGVNSAGATSTVNAMNGPQVTAGASVSFAGGGAAVVLDSALTLNDSTGTTLSGATVSIVGAISGDVLNFVNQHNITGNYNGATGVLTLAGTDTVADYQAALESISYSFAPANGDPTSGGTLTGRTIDWTVNDGVATSNIATSALATVHTAPSVAAGATAIYEVGGPGAVLDATLLPSDADSGGNLTGATVTIAANAVAGDALNFITQNGIAGSFSGDILTLSGTATIAEYRTALESVTFSTTATTAGTRTIQWTVNDSSLSNGVSAAASSTVDVVTGPVVTAGATVTFTQGDAPVGLDTTLSVTDANIANLGGATVTIANFVSGDTLGFTNQNSITGSYNAATGVLTLSGPDTIADYQIALESVSYSFSGDPTVGGAHPSRTIDWQVRDNAKTSAVATSSLTTVAAATSTTALAVTTGGSTATFDQGGSAVTIDSGILVTDAANVLSATVSITTGLQTGDALNIPAADLTGTNITESYSAGVLTLSGSDTAAHYQLALSEVTFSSTASPLSTLPRTIAFSATDGTVSGSGNDAVDIHDQPVVTAGAVVTYTGGGGAAVLDNSLTLNDRSSATLQGATVSIGGFVSGDTLAFTTLNGINGTYDSTTGILTLTGSASIGEYQYVLDSVNFSFTPGGDPTVGETQTLRTINWSVNDGTLGSATATSQLNVVHTEPVVTANGSVTFTGGSTTPVTVDSNVTVSTVDSGDMLATATVTIENLVAGDTLNFVNTTNIQGSYNSATGTLLLSGNDTIADYEAALQSITYSFNPSNGDPTAGATNTQRAVAWVVNDIINEAGSNAALSTIFVKHVAPVVTAGNTIDFGQGSTPVVIDSALTVTDVDSSGNLTGASVQIYGGANTGDALADNGVSNGLVLGNIHASYNSATAILTLTGTDTIADYQTALREITYGFSPSSGDPAGGGSDPTRSIRFTVTDAASSSSAFSTIDIVAGPVISGLTSATFLGGSTTATTLDSTLILGDAASSTITGATVSILSGLVNGATDKDVLSFNGGANTETFFGDGATITATYLNGQLVFSGPASVADYQAALQQVQYSFSPVNGDPTSAGSDNNRLIGWSVTDGNSSVNAAATSSLHIVHETPVVTAGASVAFGIGGGAVAVDSALTVTVADSDGDLTGATVKIGAGFVSGDALAFTVQGSKISGGYNAVTGVLTLSGTDTLANYQATLESITFSTTATTTGSRTIDWVANDGSAVNGISAAATSTVAVVHGPVVTAGATATFTGGGTAQPLDASLSVLDPLSTTLSSATVTIVGAISGDTLNFTNDGIHDGDIAIASNSAGQLVLTSASGATLTQWDAALDSVTYSFNPANGDPTAGGAHLSRTIDWSVNDGTTISAIATSTLNTVHAAPTVVAGVAVGFEVGSTAGVTLDAALTVNDADSAGNLAGATVKIGAGFAVGDTLNFTTHGNITGIYNAATGVLTLSGTDTVLNYQTALDSIIFTTMSTTTGIRSIGWIANDGSTSNGANVAVTSTVDVEVGPVVSAGGTATFTGGGSPAVLDSTLSVIDAFSTTLSSATVTISGAIGGDSLNFTNDGIHDGDITIASNAGGQLVLTSAGGATLAQWNAALDSVTYSFTPGGDPTGGGTHTSRSIDWAVNDGHANSAVATSTLDLVHVIPVVTPSGVAATYELGATSPVALDGGLAVTDVDSGGTLTGATVQITNFVSGDSLNFTSLGNITGSYSAATGVLTLSGSDTLADYRTVLDTISFSTTSTNTTTRSIDWVVTDAASTSTHAFSSLNVVTGPQLTAGGTVTFHGGDTTVTLDSLATVTDASSANLLSSVTVSISSGFIAGDTLSADTTGLAVNASYDAVHGVLTLSGLDTPIDYQHVLDSITYSFNPANGDPTAANTDTVRTISWVANDGVANSNVATSTLDTVHVAPTVTPSGSTAEFGIGGPGVALDPALVATDVDSGGTLASATISIGAGFLNGQDSLGFVNNGTTEGNIQIASNANGQLVLTSAGATATLAQWDAALDAVTFSTTVNVAGTRTIDWSVSDTASTSTQATSPVDVVFGPQVTAGATASFTGGGSPAVLDSGLSITDPVSTTLDSATVKITGFVNGDTLNFTNDGINEGNIAISSNASGQLVLTSSGGTATLVQWDAALASVSYSFNPANGDPTAGGAQTSRIIDWTVNDGLHTSTAVTSTLDLVHAAPVITAGQTATFAGGGAPVTLDPSHVLTLVDVDSAGDLSAASVSIGTGFISGDTLGAVTAGTSITASYNAALGILSLSGQDSIAHYLSVLDSVTYSFSPANADPTVALTDNSRVIHWVVNDGVANSGSAASSINVVHTPPTVDAGATVSFTGGSASAVTLDSALTLTVPDSSGELTGATVTINSGLVNTPSDQDVLSFNNGTNTEFFAGDGATITASYASGTLTFSGTALAADYQTALQRVQYFFHSSVIPGLPTIGDPTNGGGDTTRNVVWQVNDGISLSPTSGVGVNASSMIDTLHVAPIATAGSAATFTGGGSAVQLDGTVKVSDVNSDNLLSGATVTISSGLIAGDTLSADTTGTAIVASYNNGVLTLKGADTLIDYQHVLDSITYSFNPANGDPTGGGGDTARTITWVANDGNTSNGLSAAVSSTLTTVHVAPVVAGANNSVEFDQVTAGTQPAVTVDVAIAVTDVDSADLLTGATARITAGLFAGDTLSADTTGTAITANYLNGLLTLSGTDTVEHYQQVMQSVSFSSTNLNPSNDGADPSRTIAWSVTDGNTGAGIGNLDQSTTVTVHAAPIVLASSAPNYNAGPNTSVALDPTISVFDGTTLTGATVTITSGFANGDVLSAITAGTSIQASYDATHGVMTLTGADTPQNYQSVLASIALASSQSQNSAVTIAWQISDSNHVTSVVATSQVNVTASLAPPPLFPTAALPDTPPTQVPDNGPSYQPETVGFGTGEGFGTGFGNAGNGFSYSVVHTDPVLSTADAQVQINLALAALEAPLGGDVASIEARQADGKPLPSWLKFDPATGTFAGLPPDNAVASLAPDQSSDNNIVTGALRQDFDGGTGRNGLDGSNTITVEVLARDSKGNIAVTVFTIDLRTPNAGKHGWNMQPFGRERHAALVPTSPELAAIEAAVRDVTRPIELHGMPVRHGDAISVDSQATAAAGRAGLTEQLASIGWRSMAAQRNALLASLQQGR